MKKQCAMFLSVVVGFASLCAMVIPTGGEFCNQDGDVYDSSGYAGTWTVTDATHATWNDGSTDFYFKYFSASGQHKQVTSEGGSILVPSGKMIEGGDVCEGEECHFEVTDTTGTDIMYIDGQE